MTKKYYHFKAVALSQNEDDRIPITKLRFTRKQQEKEAGGGNNNIFAIQ